MLQTYASVATCAFLLEYCTNWLAFKSINRSCSDYLKDFADVPGHIVTIVFTYIFAWSSRAKLDASEAYTSSICEIEHQIKSYAVVVFCIK